MNNKDIIEKLLKKGLKVTPQRIAVMEAIESLKNHPTAEKITEFIKIHHPNIATGTVYKVLDAFVENKLAAKIKTDKDVMRYEPYSDVHHHLYCAESDRIEDYEDEELNILLKEYFKKKKLRNFRISDIRLQLNGNFTNNNSLKN
jgi:Fur family peroxide stress response transcriptional regulator